MHRSTPTRPNLRIPPARALAALGAGIVFAACAPRGPVSPPDPASVHVVLDGEMDDWAGIPDLITDETPEPDTAGIELASLQAWDDPAWLYLALETEEPLNLQSMPGTIQLLLDADNDETTGLTVGGWAGAEVVLDMSRRPADSDREYGAGFGLRVASGPARKGLADVEQDGAAVARNPYDLQVTALPTYSATAFEMRLARRPSASGGRAGTGLPELGGVIRVGVRAVAPDSAGTLVDALEATAYRFRTGPGPDPFEPTLEPLRSRPPGSFRVASWNVSEGRFREPADHARMLAVVEPDVVLLDEVYEEVDDEALARFFGHPALAALGSWEWVISRAGGRQKTVVAARDMPVRPEPALRAVRYAPGALDALRQRVDSTFHRALVYEEAVGMSATGAWVEVTPGVEGLFVPVDLQSAGYDGSPQDILRLLQAGTVKRLVGRAVTARVAAMDASGPGAADPEGDSPRVDKPPVVIAGDLNLVGARAPLDLLLTDRRDPYGPLRTAHLPRLDEATVTTWRSPRQALFAPGRLDFTLYSSDTLEQAGGFVFALDGLTDAQLDTLALERDLAWTVSDHQIMVTDLQVRPR